MGMPVTVEILNADGEDIFEKVYGYFEYVDHKFSTYKTDSEITRINRGEISPKKYSKDMSEVLRSCEETKQLTNGYFDIRKPDGTLDPSGLVKGWAIYEAAEIIAGAGFKNYYVDAGGDIQMAGKNPAGEKWRVGIRNPFNVREIIKVLSVTDVGVATSGNYERGLHIYNPKTGEKVQDIASITVIGPNIYEADRFVTAAFVMGKAGIEFIEKLPGLEGYMIDNKGMATYTSGFEKYVYAG